MRKSPSEDVIYESVLAPPDVNMDGLYDEEWL